jgi:hypothetical protein
VVNENAAESIGPGGDQITILPIFMMTRHPPFLEEKMDDYRCIYTKRAEKSILLRN